MTHKEARAFVKDHINSKGDKAVVTTEALVRYWWGVLNVAVFYGKLHKPIEVEIKDIRDSFAWVTTHNKKKGRVNLRIQSTFVSKLLFVTILLHEMVHAWEHQHHTVMGHGKRFHAWKNRINRVTGLELKETPNEDDYRYE